MGMNLNPSDGKRTSDVPCTACQMLKNWHPPPTEKGVMPAERIASCAPMRFNHLWSANSATSTTFRFVRTIVVLPFLFLRELVLFLNGRTRNKLYYFIIEKLFFLHISHISSEWKILSHKLSIEYVVLQLKLMNIWQYVYHCTGNGFSITVEPLF